MSLFACSQTINNMTMKWSNSIRFECRSNLQKSCGDWTDIGGFFLHYTWKCERQINHLNKSVAKITNAFKVSNYISETMNCTKVTGSDKPLPEELTRMPADHWLGSRHRWRPLTRGLSRPWPCSEGSPHLHPPPSGLHDCLRFRGKPKQEVRFSWGQQVPFIRKHKRCWSSWELGVGLKCKRLTC